MIGIDRATGRTLSGWEQFASRVQQVMSTQIGSREKRRAFGSRVPETLGKNNSDQQLMLAQSYAIAAFYPQINGIDDYQVSRCVATRHKQGMVLQLDGLWQGQQRRLEVKV